MSIDRDAFRCITYECDACNETLDTDEEEWGSALAKMKAEGWVSRKVVNEWMHFCPEHRNVK